MIEEVASSKLFDILRHYFMSVTAPSSESLDDENLWKVLNEKAREPLYPLSEEDVRKYGEFLISLVRERIAAIPECPQTGTVTINEGLASALLSPRWIERAKSPDNTLLITSDELLSVGQDS